MSQPALCIHDVDVVGEPFEDMMAMLDAPVFVVTTQADAVPSGCLVSFATQTSVQPPSFMIGMPTTSRMVEPASRSDCVAVHVLARRHQALAELFGSQAGEEADKFERCSWRAGPYGMPILDDAAAWFVGKILSRSDVGDHVAYLLEPIAVWAPDAPEELLYLSDLDVEDFEPGQEEPTRFHKPAEVTRRYGVRFTLDYP
ncbi:flavin reductase family protein [Mycobacterium marinum]|uniref:flavin reductase family protein n=1 Tax=Mycobacterium marinum TaxID=1781 RepID=UPI000B96DCC8